MKNIFLFLFTLLIATSCRKNVDTTKSIDMPNNPENFQIITNVKTDLSMFPKAYLGYKMVAIEVPEKSIEKNFKLEVLVGRTQEVDCNYYFMMGTSEIFSLDGGGYNYTKITSDGGVSGTKMGCPENSKKKEFVYMTPMMFEYNSRFPQVIYVPDFCEVKYRIWSVNDLKHDAVTIQNSGSSKELIRDCPDEKIINAMPTVSDGDGEGGLPRVYYIYKGVRKELYEFDEDWVSKNCKIKTTTAH